MKKQKHNVHGEATASAPRGKGRGYVGMVCEHVARGVCATYPSHDNAHALHQRLHVKHDGTKVFFDEYHTTKQEACELICAELGI